MEIPANLSERRKPMKLNIVRTVFFLAALLLSLAGVGAAEDDRACSLHRVAGEWGYTVTGTLILPTGPSLLATVGKYTIDAEGNVSATQTTSKGGNIFEETVKGTLTVNSDCTGTLTVSVYDPSGTTLDRTAVWAVVFVDNESEFRAILKSVALEPGSTSTPPIATEDAKKLFPDHGSQR
jgi:hypothetical protein